MQDKSRDLPRNFFAEQAMVHLQNALSSNARTESEQTVQIEQEFQKLRYEMKHVTIFMLVTDVADIMSETICVGVL